MIDKNNNFKIGQVVRSKAGRDKGDWMVVTELIGDDFVSVCNGANRKISNPKKKKIKHLAKTNYVSPLIKEKRKKNIKVSNSDIRKILEPYNRKIEN